MAYDFSTIKTRLGEIEEWFKKELTAVHTGRATPALLDGVIIDSYGTKTAIPHVAAISVEDARTLRVAPWDKGQIKDIEQAISKANLSVSVSSDDAGVRVFFAELTAERRETLAKVVKEKLEEARVSVRKEREEVWSDVQDKERAGELTLDEKFLYKDDLQKIVDEANVKIEVVAENKEQDLRS